jgi:hypothetical protein
MSIYRRLMTFADDKGFQSLDLKSHRSATSFRNAAPLCGTRRGPDVFAAPINPGRQVGDAPIIFVVGKIKKIGRIS